MELSADMFHDLGAAANVTRSYVADLAPGVDLTLVTETLGPCYTWRHGSLRGCRLSGFGQVVIGEAHGLNSIFVNPVEGV
jgi:hypothetical protein